jgi:hypothetical protein
LRSSYKKEDRLLLNRIVNILRRMFEDKSLLKLGFDFCSEDVRSIRSASEGIRT